MLDEETIQTALKQIETMLCDPTLEIESSVGLIHRPNYDTGCMEAEQTGGRTITLKVQGGGVERQESAEESAFRLRRDLRTRMSNDEANQSD
jgi:hypothetical protein